MKKNLIIFFTGLILFILQFSILAGQEKRIEQKIKIVIDDGSGTKVVIDTLIKDGLLTDSIKLKDGKVIYIDHPDESPEHISVTVNPDGNGSGKEVEKITVISSDSVKHPGRGEYGKDHIYYISKSHKGKYKGISRASENDGKKGEKIVYINECETSDKGIGKEIDKTYDVYLSSDEKDSDGEMARYVIAKDGMVVTVESKDEAKAKDLINQIKEKMGVNGDENISKETVKGKPKKHQRNR